MAIKRRMNGEERKQAIKEAARREFSMKGYYGASMRDIARAAQISESLIYQHFTNKEELYKEAYFYLDDQVDALCEFLGSLEPSTETLVKIIYSLSLMILTEVPGHSDDQKIFERLLTYSLLENADFAQATFHKYETDLLPIWNACYEKAYEAGDLHEQLVFPGNKLWFTHHLAMAIRILHMAGVKLFNYAGDESSLIDSMVTYVLRGTGLTDEAVKKYAHSEALNNLLNEIFGPKEPTEKNIRFLRY